MAYGRVEETFWHDDKTRGLTEDGRLLYLYLLTGPHRNRLGCYVLDLQYAAADIQWVVGRVEEALEELIEIDRVAWDSENRMILVKRFLKYNTMENTNVVKGARSDLKALPDTPLFIMLLEALTKYSKPHYAVVIEALRNRLPNGYPNHIANPGFLITKPSPSLPSLTEPSHAHTRGTVESEFFEWLGDQAEVLDRYIDATGAEPSVIESLWCAFRPTSMQGEKLMAGLSDNEQRAAMAATLEAHIGEKKPYQQNVFRAILRDNAALFRDGVSRRPARSSSGDIDPDQFSRGLDAAMIRQTGSLPK